MKGTSVNCGCEKEDKRIMNLKLNTHADLLEWLREDDAGRLESLWQEADAVRREQVGDAVHLRGLIEFSNICARECLYCGLRAPNTSVKRYRMEMDEIVGCARESADFGYGTVVLQSGEESGLDAEWMTEVLRRIKGETGLAVTLSLGERSREELLMWREAGADRYLLRLETSNPKLYNAIHPPRRGADAKGLNNRVELLREMREIGYEIGSGVMIGIPGQRFEDLADDLMLFRELDLDMIGMGPFIAHPSTPLGRGELPEAAEGEQVEATELMTYKMVALARLVCPASNIPSTTALATINKESGRELGLQRGANVCMPNMTPVEYRACYEIYPSKACIFETSEACNHCLTGRIHSIGRSIGSGPGDSPNYRAHNTIPAAKEQD